MSVKGQDKVKVQVQVQGRGTSHAMPCHESMLLLLMPHPAQHSTASRSCMHNIDSHGGSQSADILARAGLCLYMVPFEHRRNRLVKKEERLVYVLMDQ